MGDSSKDQLQSLRNVMFSMNKLRLEKDSCDFTIIINGKPIYAHKVVLSACSPYFKAMIRGDFKEAKESQVLMRGLEYESVESLVKFFYTAQIDITEKNVESLFDAANCMEVSVILADSVANILATCDEDYHGDLNPANCVCTLFYIADKYALSILSEAAKNYILNNFSKITDEQLLRLPYEHFMEIIKSDQLNVESELTVYESVKKWTLQNNMEQHFTDLMKHVRFSQIDLMTLASISRDPLIKSNETCRDYLDEAKTFLTSQYNIEESPIKDSFQARGATTCLYTFGGSSPTQRYNPINDLWIETDLAIVRRERFGLTVWDNVLYFVGGSICRRTASNYVARYNPYSNMTTEEAPLPLARWDIGVTVLGQFLYAIGGRDRSHTYINVDRYDPNLKEWKKCAPLADMKSEVGVATLGNHIYAIGGWFGNQNTPYDSVERYDPQLDQWTLVRPMNTFRSSPGCTVFDGKIYVVGGYDGHEFLSCGETYDPVRNRWESIPPMSYPRNRLSLVVMDGLIYAVGGEFGHATNLVEAYDPVKRVWSKCCPMKLDYHGRSVAIKGLKI